MEGLQENTDPIRIVERRMGEPGLPEHRCYHEDGRGRCTSYDTTPYHWITPGGRVAVDYYCAKHREYLE